jgi:hypothetical protein
MEPSTYVIDFLDYGRAEKRLVRYVKEFGFTNYLETVLLNLSFIEGGITYFYRRFFFGGSCNIIKRQNWMWI